MQLEGELNFKSGDPTQVFQKKKKLGEGAGGIVYECVDRRTQELVAVKIAPREEMETLKSEIALQSLSKHENVVQFLETYNVGDQVWIVIELMDGGALTNIVGRKIKWPESCMAYVLQQCLQGLESLHACYRLHRDIKSDNILWDYKGRIKLADFGFAVTLTEEEFARTSVVGTPYWMAPELIKAEDYDQKVDVWSLGITAIEMAQGQPPMMKRNCPPLKALLKITVDPPPRLKHPSRWAPEFDHFLRVSLVKNPEDRASTRELLMHPLMSMATEIPEFCKFLRELKDPTPMPPPKTQPTGVMGPPGHTPQGGVMPPPLRADDAVMPPPPRVDKTATIPSRSPKPGHASMPPPPPPKKYGL